MNARADSAASTGSIDRDRRGGRSSVGGGPASGRARAPGVDQAHGTAQRTAGGRSRSAADKATSAPAREPDGGGMRIALKARERIYLNGAVVRVDRKVGIELLNDVDFLLEQHVMQVEEATTPVRQLYFAAQAILLDPPNRREAKALFQHLVAATLPILDPRDLTEAVEGASEAVAADRPFDALRTLRRAFTLEASHPNAE